MDLFMACSQNKMVTTQVRALKRELAAEYRGGGTDHHHRTPVVPSVSAGIVIRGERGSGVVV